MKHQDHFRCTITCGYCGKRRHYEDECHIKKRNSDEVKREEEESQKNWRNKGPNGPKTDPKGGPNKGGNGSPQQRSSAPPTSFSPKGPKDPKQGEKRPPPPSIPTAGGDNPPKGGGAESNNAKKRRLAWMAKSLLKASVKVDLPTEG